MEHVEIVVHTWTFDSCCGTFIYLWTMLQRYGIDICTFAIGLIRVRSNCADVAITSCDIATLTCLFTSVQLKSCMEYSGAYSLIHLEWFQYVTQAPLDIRELENATSDAGSCGSTLFPSHLRASSATARARCGRTPARAASAQT